MLGEFSPPSLTSFPYVLELMIGPQKPEPQTAKVAGYLWYSPSTVKQSQQLTLLCKTYIYLSVRVYKLYLTNMQSTILLDPELEILNSI